MNRVIVVTGASSGIGAAAALRFARQGNRMVLAGRDNARLARVAGRIAYAGGRASIVSADLSEPDAALKIAAAAGPADLVIHAAGAGRWLPLLDTTADDARAMMAVPAFAAIGLAQAFAPSMIARGSGRFVFVTSPGSWLVWPNATAYLAARHALKAIAEGLRAELRKTGVGVTLVALGEVESPYWEHNQGSRANLPRALPVLMPPLTADQAAATIVKAVAAERNLVFRPAIFRAIVAANAIAPGLVARRMRRT